MREYNLKVGNKVFKNGTHVMGILNVTPDSFFADSRVGDNTIEVAKKMIADGAEILDVGGQSTRPGHKEVSWKEEIERVVPKVRELKKLNCLISVDTYYPEVAEAVLAEGADMINDVSMLKDKRLAEVIAKYDASVCLMHNRRESSIDDLFEDKIKGLENAIKILRESGVDSNKILLDGGIGFNRNNTEDWELLKNYDKLVEHFDYPILLGTSMKSMFGGDINTRLKPTVESTALAKKQGVLFVRVHNVLENMKVLKENK